jgi:hypothetical protein
MDMDIIIHEILPKVEGDIQRFRAACICKHVLNSYTAMNPDYDRPYRRKKEMVSCLSRMMALAKRGGSNMVSWSFAIDFNYYSTRGRCFTIQKRSAGKYINSIVHACHMSGDQHTDIAFRTEDDVIRYFSEEFIPFIDTIKFDWCCRYKSKTKKKEFEALTTLWS